MGATASLTLKPVSYKFEVQAPGPDSQSPYGSTSINKLFVSLVSQRRYLNVKSHFSRGDLMSLEIRYNIKLTRTSRLEDLVYDHLEAESMPLISVYTGTNNTVRLSSLARDLKWIVRSQSKEPLRNKKENEYESS